MANVPTALEAGLGRERIGSLTTPFQSTAAPADAFGAAQGRVLSAAGQGLASVGVAATNIALTDQAAEDERNILEVEEQVRTWRVNNLFGADGVYNKKGVNATIDGGLQKTTDDSYRQFSSGLMQGRTMSARARLKTEDFIKRQGSGISVDVGKYELSETNSYHKGLLENRITGAKEDSALDFNQPLELAQNKIKIATSVVRLGQMNGWSDEETQERVEQEVSSMHSAVINRMLGIGQGIQAKTYMEANIDEIDGADITALESKVLAGDTVQKAQVTTDGIMAQQLPETEALKSAREIEDPALRDATVKRLKARYGEQDAAVKANEKALQDSSWAVISRGGTPDDLSADQLTASKNTVDRMWTMVNNRQKRGKPYAMVSDSGVLDNILSMTDEEIVDVDLTANQPQLTEGDYSKALKRQNSAKEAIEKLQDNPGQAGTINRLLKQYAPKDWSFGLAKASDTKRALGKQATDRMNDFVNNTIERTNKAPTEDEMRNEAARLMMSIELDEAFFTFGGAAFDAEGTVVQLQDEDLTEFEVADEDISQFTGIPIGNLDEIRDIIANGGFDLTIGNMVKVWETRTTK